MAQPENVIYKTIITGIITVVVLTGIYYIITSRRQAALPLTPPPIQGDVSIQAGFFTVSQAPGKITLKKGDIKPVEVKITVLPFDGFAEAVTFAVEDIIKDGQSVKAQTMFNAKFASSKLESKNFGKGILLTITPAKETPSGNYVISYRAQSPSIKKDFIVPVSVQ